MDIVIKRRDSAAPVQPRRREPPFFRIGEYGRVMKLHSEDNTVDVLLDSGVFLKHVRVRSMEWVIYQEDTKKDFNAGERDLPPLHTRVFILMPDGTYNDCFVLCSLFSTPDKAKPFLADDRERIKEGITPSGWHITDDNDTGSHKAVSPDKETGVSIDYGSKDEPLAPPELHAWLFDGKEPGIKIDAVSGKTLDIDAFDEFHAKHKKGDSLVISAFDTEIIIKRGLMEIHHNGDYNENIQGNKTITVGKDIITKAGGDIITVAGGTNRDDGASVHHN